MNRLYFGNFDFEHQLADAGRAPLTPFLQRLNAELACVWLALAEPGDTIWAPAALDPEFAVHLLSEGLPRVPFVSTPAQLSQSAELCPWGWSLDVVNWGRRHGIACSHPPLPAVAAINCRLFGHRLEVEWQVGLDGARIIQSPADLADALRGIMEPDARWVLKCRFGMSGRERLPGRGSTLTEPMAGWLRRRLARDGAVVFEPWVERVAEAGLQFEIPRAGSGEPVLIGVTPLLTDAAGGYRGSRLSSEPSPSTHLWDEAVASGLRAAERAQSAGYFGPLGIDAMRYRDTSGGVRTRPLQDLNARYTMGRLSLGFRRLLTAGGCGTWLHLVRGRSGRQSQGSAASSSASIQETPPLSEQARHWSQNSPPGVRIIPTSPDLVGGLPVGHATLLITAPSEAARELAEGVVFPEG